MVRAEAEVARTAATKNKTERGLGIIALKVLVRRWEKGVEHCEGDDELRSGDKAGDETSQGRPRKSSRRPRGRRHGDKKDGKLRSPFAFLRFLYHLSNVKARSDDTYSSAQASRITFVPTDRQVHAIPSLI